MNINHFKHTLLAPALLTTLGLGGLASWTPDVAAQTGKRMLIANQAGDFHVPVGKAGIIKIYQRVKRVSLANPAVADIMILSGQQVYIIGKALGSTNVVLWDHRDQVIENFDVEVTHDLVTLKQKLYTLLPGEQIKVNSAQENIILSGQATNVVKMDAAMDIASSFLQDCIKLDTVSQTTINNSGSGKSSNSKAGSVEQECKEGKVLNMMQVGGAQQVMLEVKVAEVARTVVKGLDSKINLVDFGKHATSGAVTNGVNFPDALNEDGLETPLFGGNGVIGPVVDKIVPNDPGIADTGLFLSYMTGSMLFQAILEVSKEKGIAKILAEPTLTTLTGQEAQFLSGGEFPIPVPQGGNNSGTITIKFKEFGVGVKFLPLVLDSGNINLKLNVSVSELSSEIAVQLGLSGSASTFAVPSLTKRTVGSTVELADGQTIGIAGLINDDIRENVQKFPGLGDIPVLGALFRSQQFLSGQTELVIFVTPHLARPISPDQIRMPTDVFVPSSDLEFYLMGKMEGSDNVSEADIDVEKASQYGHQL